MSLTQEKALFHLAGKLELAKLSTEDLQKMAGQYPYFIPAQFFLAVKESNASIIKSDIPTQKVAVYFSNPYWLWYQLQHCQEEGKQPGSANRIPINPIAPIAVPTFEEVKEIIRKIDPVKSINTENEDSISETEKRIAGILSGQLEAFHKPLDPNERLDIEMEEQRLHTIDYFASQGIKIDLSTIPQDKLTRHLLKFTDWLKQIKQINPSDLGTSLEMEKAVAETAKNSNETKEILTETMAEVLIKQGQKEKAIQLLIKLSFLNPEKSSYFAAKIEQLKGI